MIGVAHRSGSVGTQTNAAPAVDPLQLFAHLESWIGQQVQDAFYLETGPQDAVVGLGAAAVLTASGPDRFRFIQQQAQALAERNPSRFFGGFAFENQVDGSWAPFGSARFVVPRWLYEVTGGEGRLTLTLSNEESDGLAAQERWRLVDAMTQLPRIAPVPEPEKICPPADQFEADVGRGVEVIRSGGLDKVVLSRRFGVKARRAYRAAPVLNQLHDAGGRRFAFVRPGAFFAGCTPELLVRKKGGRVHSEALAGSADPGALDRLVRNKERIEHAYVADAVVAALRALSIEVTVGPPRPAALAHVAHLRTPIHGIMARPQHILRLVAALHPTPAVGGVPRSPALEWIAQTEATPRGWYAGPIGWFDAEGDGEFLVALRSGLFRGSEARIYAGAGLVQDSKPEEEAAETELKAKTVLGALGVKP